MARIRFGLCLILTIGMAGSRRSDAVWSGSSSSNAWWEAEEFSSIAGTAARLRAARDLLGLEKLYQDSYKLAVERRILPAQITYLTALGNTYLLAFRYGDALQSYVRARTLARTAQDWSNAGLIALNLTALYQQIGDLPSALRAAEEGKSDAARSGAAYYRAELLLQLARLYSLRGDNRAEQEYREGIQAAADKRDARLQAQGLNLLGEQLLGTHHLKEAEDAIIEGFRLHRLFAPGGLRMSYAQLGALRLAQASNGTDPALHARLLAEAERFTRNALYASASRDAVGETYTLENQLGKILAAEGRLDAALSTLKRSVQLASAWRATIPPAASFLNGSNAQVAESAFDSFVELSADQALRGRCPSCAWQSFLAEETNRAASLRETQALTPLWKQKLPPQYWKTVDALRKENARLLAADQPTSKLADRLKLEITEMEAVAGLGFLRAPSENLSTENSLIQFQRRLTPGELLLSFHLGQRQSYLWAVTRGTLHLYALDSESGIQKNVTAFRAAISEGRPEGQQLGERIGHSLLGRLNPEERKKPRWLLSLEGSLLDLPFAAVVTERTGDRVSYLIERHSIQILPGAFSLSRSPERSNEAAGHGRLLLVGDPVYNTADQRWLGRRSTVTDGITLNRLPGSGREVEACARSWGGSGATLLTGTAATRSGFLQASQIAPTAIHLATHVVANPESETFVAFGLGADGKAGLLSAGEIAALNIPRSLVVMTGCAAATGEILPGAGRMGLTHSWLVAGASGVIATGWPVPDRPSRLMPEFYQYWKSISAAEALRRSQLDMLHSGTWEALPSQWAAFQLTGGVR